MELTYSSSPRLLGEMPDELMLAIVSHLEIARGCNPEPSQEEERQIDNKLILKSLHSLTLTSRKLAHITTLFLYTNFI